MFLLFSFSAETGIILNLAKSLESGQYTVVLRVADNHGMEQDSTIQAKVCDCTGKDVQCTDTRGAVAEVPLILGILGGILLLLSKSTFFKSLKSLIRFPGSLGVNCNFKG